MLVLHQPWQSPNAEELRYWTKIVENLVERLLPPRGTTWTTDRRQDALDLSDKLREHSRWPYPARLVLADMAVYPDPYQLARVYATKRGHRWPSKADPLLFACLNVLTLDAQAYEDLTGPWRVLVGPVMTGSLDPKMSDLAKIVGEAMLRRRVKISVQSLMETAISVAAAPEH